MARAYNGAKTVSSINGVWKTGLVHAKIETRPPTLTICKNELMDKRLKLSCETIKILEEIIDSKISDIQHRNIFAHISPKALETKQKINTWNYIELKKILYN